ncbi:MAG: TRAP transporter small permease [Candidatus Desulfacyla sp.]
MKVSFFEKTVIRSGDVFNMVASASLVAMMLLTCADVLMRYAFSRPIIGTYDLVSLMGAVVVSFAMPYTMLKKGHVAVEFLIQNLSKDTQRIIETFTHLIAVSLFSVLIWQAIILAMDMKAAGEVTPTLLLPFYPILYCMAVCFFGLCLAILVNLSHIWTKRAK